MPQLRGSPQPRPTADNNTAGEIPVAYRSQITRYQNNENSMFDHSDMAEVMSSSTKSKISRTTGYLRVSTGTVGKEDIRSIGGCIA